MGAALSAQAERFDVASIKVSNGSTASRSWSYRGRRFTARYVTLTELISVAYAKPEQALSVSQMSGGPKWIESDRFDVEATAPGVPDSVRGTFSAPILAMLRGLLEDRFHLQAHVEVKEQPVYALVLARRDGALGPMLRRRTTDCIARTAAPQRTPLFDVAAPDRQVCGGRAGPGTLTSNGATMNNIAQGLARLVPGVDRVVIDRTGLTGTYDFDLKWNFEGTADHLGVALPPPDRSLPSLFTALEEQLGLKLESTRAAIDVLVIDRVEKLVAD